MTVEKYMSLKEIVLHSHKLGITITPGVIRLLANQGKIKSLKSTFVNDGLFWKTSKLSSRTIYNVDDCLFWKDLLY